MGGVEWFRASPGMGCLRDWAVIHHCSEDKEIQMSKRTLLTMAGTTALVVAGWSSQLHAQCDVTPGPGAIEQDDACGSDQEGFVDSNGGCNVAGNPTQLAGSLSASNPTLQVYGTVGTYTPFGATEPTSRYLDWWFFDVDAPGTVTFSVTNLDGSSASYTITFFATNGFDCETQEFVIGTNSDLCPFEPAVTLPNGTHKFIVTVPFAGDGGAPCPLDYRVTVAYEPGLFPECGAAKAGSCIEAHPTGGCDNFACCEIVCDFEPLCCVVEWDQSCVDLALDPDLGCGLYVYECPTGSSFPANNCPTGATVVSGGDSLAFNTLTASTVGPRQPQCNSADADEQIWSDLWYSFTAPGDGSFSASTCGTASFDTKIAIYDIGNGTYNPADLPDLFIACNEDGPDCPDSTSFLEILVEANVTYLVRLGGFLEATGNGTVVFEFLNVIYNTGGTRQILNNGAPISLGLSSGYLNATFPQRWIASPFTVPAPTAPDTDSWLVQTIAANGFTPAGSVNETMEWIIWERDAATNAAPVDGEQVVSGSVPFPAPIDDPTGDPTDEQHDIATDFVLAPGDYYLTVYAANSTGGASAANFAWFCNAPDGIDLVDAQGPFCWRSATQPTPGFQRYTLPAQYQQQEGLDPNDLYAVGFKLLGVPYSGGEPPILGDLNGDGIVNGADLAILLGCWGTVTNPACTPADLNADGAVNGADLAIQLGNWTN